MIIKKAAVWADSILKGVIYDEDIKKYRICKESGLNICSSKSNIKIVNNSRFGLTATKALRLLEEYLENETEFPEVALIELGGNDCNLKWEEVAENPNIDHLPITPIDKFTNIIVEMVVLLREYKIEPILVNLPPIDPEKYFAWVSKGLNKENILSYLGGVNTIYTHHEMYSLAIMQVAKEYNCQLLNVREEFLKKKYKQFLCLDGIHLNEKGQKVLGNIFSKESYLC